MASKLLISISEDSQDTLDEHIAIKVKEGIKKGFEEFFNNPIERKMYLTKKEACIYLSVSYATLQKLIAQGMPVIQIDGKILLSKVSINEYLKSIEK
ncbi:hypothetical protein [Trichococcus sp.]|uniref:hypothetical protein n=1 Tax=Trichococcus sp. TaxID=1985464 RepID=UPI003C7CF6E4